MLKVLYIIPRLLKGGAERLCLDICNQLHNRSDVQVKLITFSVENAYPFLTENIDWQVIASQVKLSMHRRNQIQIAALQRAIDDFAPDVIHTHLFEAEIVSRSCYYPQAKWFSHCHDNMKQFHNFSVKTLFNKSLLTNYYEKLYLLSRYQANGGNTFIAISHDTEKFFRKTTRPYNVCFLPNAINYEKFFCDRFCSTDTKLRLVNVGSYQDKKNQRFLVQVAKMLQNHHVDFEMNLLGDGEKYSEVANLINENQLESIVLQRGNVNNVEQYLHQSDIYVHSAYYEPFGLVLLEAMAAGLPVVCLDGKGNRDIMEQGKNGYMIEQQNAEQFADRILEIWNDRQQYKEMSVFAQNFAKDYDIKTYVDNLIDIYNNDI